MKKTLLILLLSTLSVSVFAQDKKVTAVAITLDMFHKAILDADSLKLEQLTDSKLTYGHSIGRIENKKEFIHALASGESDFKTLNITDQTIIVEGKTAVVRHKLAADIKDKDKYVSIKLAVLMVWVKKDKQWKLLARQAVKI